MSNETPDSPIDSLLDLLLDAEDGRVADPRALAVAKSLLEAGESAPSGSAADPSASEIAAIVAAYRSGSLSAEERREFERRLAGSWQALREAASANSFIADVEAAHQRAPAMAVDRAVAAALADRTTDKSKSGAAVGRPRWRFGLRAWGMAFGVVAACGLGLAAYRDIWLPPVNAPAVSPPALLAPAAPKALPGPVRPAETFAVGVPRPMALPAPAPLAPVAPDAAPAQSDTTRTMKARQSCVAPKTARKNEKVSDKADEPPAATAPCDDSPAAAGTPDEPVGASGTGRPADTAKPPPDIQPAIGGKAGPP
jgi:hypothetical protein